MCDKLPTQLFRVAIDVEAQLREDREPDILWPENQIVMVGVREPCGVDESVARGGDGWRGKALERVGGEGGVDDAIATVEFHGEGRLEQR